MTAGCGENGAQESHIAAWVWTTTFRLAADKRSQQPFAAEYSAAASSYPADSRLRCRKLENRSRRRSCLELLRGLEACWQSAAMVQNLAQTLVNACLVPAMPQLLLESDCDVYS